MLSSNSVVPFLKSGIELKFFGPSGVKFLDYFSILYCFEKFNSEKSLWLQSVMHLLIEKNESI